MSGQIIDTDAELAQQMRELEDQERRDFIREAAIRLCVAHRTRDDIWEMSAADARSVWVVARSLWLHKLKDC